MRRIWCVVAAGVTVSTFMMGSPKAGAIAVSCAGYPVNIGEVIGYLPVGQTQPPLLAMAHGGGWVLHSNVYLYPIAAASYTDTYVTSYQYDATYAYFSGLYKKTANAGWGYWHATIC